MKIWLLNTGEPYPFMDDASLMRNGMLALELDARGHEVLWWGCNFFHQLKQRICKQEEYRAFGKRSKVLLLDSLSYSSNFSLKRYRNNAHISKRFLARAADMIEPDIIVSSYPIHELSYHAVQYGQKNNVPVIVDVRDLWPDIFIDPLPLLSKPIARMLLSRDFKMSSYTLSNATAIFSISDTFMNWSLFRAKRTFCKPDALFPIGSKPLSTKPDNIDEIFPWYKNTKGKTIACFIGSFGRTYDLALVLNAATRLKEAGNDEIHFVLGGSGLKYDIISRDAADLDNVTLTGWLDRTEIEALLHIADIGLSIYTADASQSLPNKPFQYMSGGLAIISSLSGDLERILQKEQIGMQYIAEDIDSFMRCLIALTGNNTQTRKMMGEKSKILFDAKYNSDIIYRQYSEAVEEIARDNNPKLEE